MPTTVIAREGDTLCGIAIANGFKNCDLLRAEGANADYSARDLRRGDVVTVPDPRVEPVQAPTDRITKLRVRRRPVPRIRFVHGSPDLPARSDRSLNTLDISNYQTNMAGANGLAAFVAGFGFDANAHADPDAFKVEIVSPDGGVVQPKIEALEPTYAADGKVESHAPFTDANAAKRRLDAPCQAMPGDAKRYRTRYLRLVSDDVDRDALPAQTIMVSDTADGNGGAADQVEILDQLISASYELPGCAAGSNKCTLRKNAPVGHNQRRIRMAIHILNAAVGGAGIGGTTEQMVRYRTARWFRRLYAQANLAPKLLGVDFLDPPPADTVVISNGHGTAASGVDGAGNPSTLRFTLDWAPGAAPVGAGAPPVVNVALSAGRTPQQVCSAIAAALPAGYAGEVQINARATNAAHASCDILVSHSSGNRLRVRAETTTDTALTIGVARVNVANVTVDQPTFQEILVCTPEARRVLRMAGTDDQLDFFVVGTITGARGVAIVPGNDVRPAFRPPAFIRWAAFMRATCMTAADTDPFSFPHEAGHVLNDAFHADQTVPPANREMMAGGGTNGANSMTATKRISGDPVQPQYQKFNPLQAAPGDWHTEAIRPVVRFRARGSRVTESW